MGAWEAPPPGHTLIQTRPPQTFSGLIFNFESVVKI